MNLTNILSSRVSIVVLGTKVDTVPGPTTDQVSWRIQTVVEQNVGHQLLWQVGGGMPSPYFGCEVEFPGDAASKLSERWELTKYSEQEEE